MFNSALVIKNFQTWLLIDCNIANGKRQVRKWLWTVKDFKMDFLNNVGHRMIEVLLCRARENSCHHNFERISTVVDFEREVDSISTHDDVIKWKHFPCYWPFVGGIHRSPVNSPQKGQWHRALMFVFFDLRQNTRLSKQSGRRWFETVSHSLWRHYNAKTPLHWNSITCNQQAILVVGLSS